MLKKLLMVIAITFMAIASNAEDGQKVASKIQKVIVFLNGAQVTRTALVDIGAGTTDLVFGGITPQVDVQSIQVHANGDFTILSVRNEVSSSSDQSKKSQIETLMNAQKLLSDKISMQNSMISIYQLEETVLAKNQFVRAENTTLDVLKLKQALDFQTERLIMLKEKEQAATRQIEALNIEMQKYNNQIYELNNIQRIENTNIIVTVYSKIQLQSLFTLSYLTSNAGWVPSYDIKAKNITSPLTIAYKGNVYQRTGEDWKNVKLTLSTGSPAVNGVKPELRPYYLNFAQELLRGRVEGANLSEVVVTGYGTEKKEADDETNALVVRQVENQTSVEFAIDNPYSIVSDGKQCQVAISEVTVKATYQYYVAPKINTHVFLTAQITDWSKYSFLPGKANLFFEGTYIGKSTINTYSTLDTLNLSLGIDKSIVVTRTLQKGLTEKQSLGANKKETRDWLIEVKNRKNQPVNLLLEDQVPVSQNSLVEVEAQETTGAKPNPLTGKVSWNFLLNSQDDKKVQLKYQVKYPKNQSVIVQ